MIIDIEYKINEEGLKILDGCAASAFIKEHKDMLRAAFDTVKVSFEYDENFNTLNIVGINNHNLCGCP